MKSDRSSSAFGRNILVPPSGLKVFFRHEDGNCVFFQNISKYLPDYMASHLRG
jgi:hypothetical protein